MYFAVKVSPGAKVTPFYGIDKLNKNNVNFILWVNES